MNERVDECLPMLNAPEHITPIYSSDTYSCGQRSR